MLAVTRNRDRNSSREVEMDTFLVHVWKPADGVAPTALRGVVRHVTSGDETPFRSDAEMLRALRRGGGPGQAGNHIEIEGN